MMYWRVRKYGVAEMFQQYGVHAALVLSVLANFLLIATRPNPNRGMSNQQKADFDQFGRKVTQHILDTSYINYQNATTDLMDPQSGELAPSVVKMLRQGGLLPNSKEEFQVSLKSYTDSKRVCAINIQTVKVSDPDAQGLVPIDVAGVIAVHSADESESYPGPVPFRFRYRVGYRPDANKQPILTQPIVSDFQDLSH